MHPNVAIVLGDRGFPRTVAYWRRLIELFCSASTCVCVFTFVFTYTNETELCEPVAVIQPGFSAEEKNKSKITDKGLHRLLCQLLLQSCPCVLQGFIWCSIHGGCQQHKGRWLLSSWSPDMLRHILQQLKCTWKAIKNIQKTIAVWGDHIKTVLLLFHTKTKEEPTTFFSSTLFVQMIAARTTSLHPTLEEDAS